VDEQAKPPPAVDPGSRRSEGAKTPDARHADEVAPARKPDILRVGRVSTDGSRPHLRRSVRPRTRPISLSPPRIRPLPRPKEVASTLAAQFRRPTTRQESPHARSRLHRRSRCHRCGRHRRCAARLLHPAPRRPPKAATSDLSLTLGARWPLERRVGSGDGQLRQRTIALSTSLRFREKQLIRSVVEPNGYQGADDVRLVAWSASPLVSDFP
jgi:hypothetical protein